MGERQLAEVCSGGRGRPATRTELDAALDALSGPDGLTGQASTFTRTDVVDALAKRLPVAPSRREALAQAEAAADRFLEERAVRVGRDRRLGVDRFSTPELLELERQLVDQRHRADRARAARSSGRGLSARSWTAMPPPARTRRPWSVTSPKAAPGWPWWWGGPGRARPGRWGWPGRPSSWTAIRSSAPLPTGIATVGLADEGFTDARTVDRLLLDLGRGRTELDGRSVLVVDEAAMVGTRKLAPLLEPCRAGGGQGGAGRRRPPVRLHRRRRRLPRPPPPPGRLRADREPAAGGGLGAAGHR